MLEDPQRASPRAAARLIQLQLSSGRVLEKAISQAANRKLEDSNATAATLQQANAAFRALFPYAISPAARSA